MPRTLKDCQEGCSFLLPFFSIIRLTYPPNLLPQADKKNLKKHSSGALLLTHSPSSTRPLFIPPTSFYIWQRDRSLFSPPLAWLAVTMVSCRHVSVQTRNTGTRSMSFFFSPWCLLFNFRLFKKKLTEQQRGLEIIEQRDLVVEMVKWQVSLFSTSHFPLYELLWMCCHYITHCLK